MSRRLAIVSGVLAAIVFASFLALSPNSDPGHAIATPRYENVPEIEALFPAPVAGEVSRTVTSTRGDDMSFGLVDISEGPTPRSGWLKKHGKSSSDIRRGTLQIVFKAADGPSGQGAFYVEAYQVAGMSGEELFAAHFPGYPDRDIADVSFDVGEKRVAFIGDQWAWSSGETAFWMKSSPARPADDPMAREIIAGMK